MLENETVLILGAGASYHLGFPLGAELKKEILENCNFENDNPSIQQQSLCGKLEPTDVVNSKAKLKQFLLYNHDFKIDFINNFYTDFSASTYGTIDAFLENNDQYEKIGKILIVYSLFCFEDSNKSFYKKENDESNWYYYLIDEIFSESWDEIININDYKLSIITYNYDVTIEYYFIEILISKFGKSISECKRIFDKIKLIHVYGALSNGSWNITVIEGGKPYNKNLIEVEYIENAFPKILVISESDGNSKEYITARSWLKNAQNIFILGFGYDQRNLERLQLKNYNAKIYSTRTGIGDKALEEIKACVENNITFSSSDKKNILCFLRDEVSIHGIIH